MKDEISRAHAARRTPPGARRRAHAAGRADRSEGYMKDEISRAHAAGRTPPGARRRGARRRGARRRAHAINAVIVLQQIIIKIINAAL